MKTSASASRPSASFRTCLTIDPNNLSAIDGIGSILYNMAGTPFTPEKFEESKKYHQKHIALNPMIRSPIIGSASSTGRWPTAPMTNCARPTTQPRIPRSRSRIRSAARQAARRFTAAVRHDGGRGHADARQGHRSYVPTTPTPWPTRACCCARRPTCPTPPRARRLKSKPTTCWKR